MADIGPITSGVGASHRPLLRFVRFGLRVLIRQYPIYSGVMRIVNSWLPRALTAQKEIVVTRLRYGPKIVVDMSDYCGRPIYYWGDYDSRITRICVDALQTGDCFLDIGANYGEVALAAAKKVGPEGIVHAFEPIPELAGFVRHSADLNGFENMRVHQVALGASNAHKDISIPEGNTGASSLLEAWSRRDGESPNQLTVTIRHAGDYFKQIGITDVAAIKIDVEGMEAEIIDALLPLIIREPPRLVAFESHDDGTPFFERKSIQLLAECGYRLFQVVVNRRLAFRPMLRPVESNDALGSGYDFVALWSQGGSCSKHLMDGD